MKSYKVTVLYAFLHGNECWTISARGMNRIESAEMRYLRTVKSSIRFHHIEHKHSRKKLKVQSVQSMTE